MIPTKINLEETPFDLKMAEEFFRIAKTYTKYRLMKIMLDGIPRTVGQLVIDFKKDDKYTSRTTIVTGLLSLEKTGTFKKKPSGYYRMSLISYPKKVFTNIALEVISELRKSERTERKLRDLVCLTEEELGEAITPLIIYKYVEHIESDILPNNAMVLRLIKQQVEH